MITSYLATITTIMGVVISWGYYFQAYNIIKNKSTKNVSLVSYIIFALGTSTWLTYGLYLMDWTIILGFAFGVIGSWLVLILFLIYRNNDRELK